jgi:hypothetical protein
MPTGNGPRDNSLVAMLLVSNLQSVKRLAASLRCEPSGRRKAQLPSFCQMSIFQDVSNALASPPERGTSFSWLPLSRTGVDVTGEDG